MAGIPLSEGVHIGRAMRSASTGLMVASILAAAGAALAGGLNYGVRPGARGNLEGKISEWAVPTPSYARDPAPGPARCSGRMHSTAISLPSIRPPVRPSWWGTWA